MLEGRALVQREIDTYEESISHLRWYDAWTTPQNTRSHNALFRIHISSLCPLYLTEAAIWMETKQNVHEHLAAKIETSAQANR
jgi:hypothetical protein